jgi:hypothetical protein
MSISLAAARAIAAALTPKHGGKFVSELTTIRTGTEPQWTYRWAYGDVIEVCDNGAYISHVGDTGSFFIDLEKIARAGEEWPDEYVIGPTGQVEPSNGTGMSVGTETFCELATLSTRRSLRAVRIHTPPMGISVADVDAAFDETFGGEP